ncbi:MAG TPA: phage tail sheath C-terminal domain-containing protein [Ktedonobacteraceae bacterium]|nr:phage tail sheath C-terminal domain-containing protein [Ktedonobacteraceae bacterium]
MPVNPTYPGVYVQEIPSGVHTIVGVSTSVTAFLGLAKRGPINTAVHIFSLKDYENAFGGLFKGTDTNDAVRLSQPAMSYAVSQFFQNGGNEAWIVRLALNAATATVDLQDASTPPVAVLTVTAIDEGTEANSIQVAVANNSVVAGTFDLTFSYISQDNPADTRTETFKGLSMDSKQSQFVENVINGVSLLVTVKVKVPTGGGIPKNPAPSTVGAGTLTSGKFTQGDIDNLPSDKQNSFNIAFDGHPADVVTLDATGVPDPGKKLAVQLPDMAKRIQNAVRAKKPGLPAWGNFTCTASPDNTTLILTSGTVGSTSSVTVSDAPQNNIADKLHLNAAGTPTQQNGTGPAQLAGGAGDPFDINTNPEVFFPTDGSRTGIFALDEVDLFNLLCLPRVTDAGTLNQAIAYCKPRRAFVIIDSQPDKKPADMVTFITDPKLSKGDNGTYAAIYYPWVQAPDPLNNGRLTSYPSSGMIAGLYASTDSSRGVWKAPAGTNANLVGVQGLDYLLTDGENGSLNPLGVNCLRIFPVYGAVSWGSRTVSGADALASEYKYVPVRRTALYIEESLRRGLQWVVFEPNDEPLWAQIRLNVGVFMHNLFVKGAFQGQTPRDAYFVKCDKETTTQNDIDLGIVNIVVGFAPLKPAEFVILSLQQIAGQLQV